MSSSSNPAAQQGWVKSTDPQTGRVFYANHVTRETQWDAPANWVEVVQAPAAVSAISSTNSSQAKEDEEPLPSNWEEMKDPTTGKPFYVDHARKITTWQRPTMAESNSSSSKAPSMRPAVASPPSSGGATMNSAAASLALARQLQDEYDQEAAGTSSSSNDNNKNDNNDNLAQYHREASYYSNSFSGGHSMSQHQDHQQQHDLSYTLPALEFTVQKVHDHLRPNCSSCNTLFSMTVRRHHCRLCGDVFCNICSAHKATLPLAGAEFAKPVRICDFCHQDVQAGQFFAFRRYLTPLHLYDPAHGQRDEETDASGVATAANVNNALCALTHDLDDLMMANDMNDIQVRLQGLPPDIWMPEFAKHLQEASTRDRTIRCLASILALESLLISTSSSSSNTDDSHPPDYVAQVYANPILLDGILEQLDHDTLNSSSASRKTLYVQEQAARILFYLTDARTMELCRSMSGGDDDDGVTASLDVHASLRSLLDHASSNSSNNSDNYTHVPLVRWSAATLRNLILEDSRRAIYSMERATQHSWHDNNSSDSNNYTSFLPELVHSGGCMLLCTILNSADTDARAHAVAALSAILDGTRRMDACRQKLVAVTTTTNNNAVDAAAMIRAICAGGGCGSAVAQQLLSADDAVAGMGLRFLGLLVLPLLESSNTTSSNTTPLELQYDCRQDESDTGACMEAALEVVNGPCLPALLSLVRGGNHRLESLRLLAAESLCSVTMATANMCVAWQNSHLPGSYEEGLAASNAPAKLQQGLQNLLAENTLAIMLPEVGGQSILGTADTPTMRIREAAGSMLGSLTACSAEAILELQQQQDVLPTLLQANDASLTVPSVLHGDGPPRCLGVLQAVGNVLMFAWQQQESDSSLLDRLIQVVDAGAIPYLSRVMNSTAIDWESSTRGPGGMKGRAAACRLLCCMFGISLEDSTGIGMRRVMEAVEADAHSYRGSKNNSSDRQLPSNLVEATLQCLQTASGYARKALIGALNKGMPYQAALFDLVGAGLWAVGSMCGSSVAPTGGASVSSESFLATRRQDAYVARREQICNIACDIVVRGGRNSGPALLPTMLVGGFGETTVGAAMRLALAIAQNGTKEQHAKLASSGVLVPITDSLKTALSKGDLYRFSAALAMVRFCGPHVAAGQGGGLDSVREAIRVATNVLTLPLNPNISFEEMERQEALKAECISALESLSKNSSLWSSISTEALPAVVRYLDFNSTGPGNPKTQATRAAALRAILQIVQVPSHAVAAADVGIADALGNILKSRGTTEDDQVPMLALEVLHVISSNEQARRRARFLEVGLVRAICNAMGKCTTHKAKQPSDSRADVTFLGMEILHAVLADVGEPGQPTAAILQSPRAVGLLNAVSGEPLFVRALCSTLLLKTNMKIPQHDDDSGAMLNVPALYGPPLLLVKEKCAGYEGGTHDAAAGFLFSLSVFACAIEGPGSDILWKTLTLQDLPGDPDGEECLRVSATLSAHYLALLTNEYPAFVPRDQYQHQEYLTLTRPLIRHRLLEMLKSAIEELSGDEAYDSEDSDPYVISLLVSFNVPHICLSLWKDPALLDLAFDLIQKIVEQVPDEVLHLFVESKGALMSLFDLLNIDEAIETSKNVAEIRQFLAFVLGQLAENGLLTKAVEKFDIRSSAIAALAAACLNEQDRPVDEDEDTTENRLSTVLMRCLVDLCSVTDKKSKKKIQLSASESDAIAKNLGRKLCQMVLSRFLERARLKEYEMDDDDDIMDAPDVAMLCAVAQHDEALKTLRSIGGLHALGLVAAEGESLAMNALKRATKDDASVLLEGEAYEALVDLIASDAAEADWRAKPSSRNELESTAFSLLARLCKSSAGRKAVCSASKCETSLNRAIEVIALFAGIEEESTPVTPTLKDDEDSEVDYSSEEESDDEDEVKREPDKPASNAVDAQVGIGACLYLASLASTRVGKTALLESSKISQALSALSAGTSDSPLDVRFAALKLVSSLAAYSTGEGTLSTDGVAEIILKALSSKEKVAATKELNKNMILDSAVTGLTTIFDHLTPEKQTKAIGVVKERFSKCVKTCILTRSTAKEKDRAHAAELCYNLSVVLLLARGHPDATKIFSQDLFVSFINLIQWRVDPKTSIGSTNGKAWDAAVSNCLLMMSIMLWKPEEVLSESNLDLAALSETTLMLARPGKAPRKAIDLRSALEKIIEGPEGSSSVAADRVIHRLY